MIEVKYGIEARNSLKNGIDKTVNAVKVTLGAKGRNVMCRNGHITKDGVTVVRDIEMMDSFENKGCQVAKNISNALNDSVGDGTTTCLVIAQDIFDTGFKNITAGANPMDLQRGIEKAVDLVESELVKQAISVKKDFDKVKQIATISANGDNIIGTFITDAIKDTTNNGVVSIIEGKGIETKIDRVKGLEINSGYLSNYFVNNNDKLETNFEDVYVVLIEEEIRTFDKLIPTIEFTASKNRPVLFIAHGFDSQVISAMAINKVKGGIKICAIKLPNNKLSKDIFEDIAIVTGACVLSKDRGTSIEEIADIKDILGEASKINITQNTTTIIDGKGDVEEIKERIKTVKSQIEITASEYDKNSLKERLAKLDGGIVVIEVGGKSESVIKELKDRYIDALHATQAAVKEGIVEGGGVALLKCIKPLKKLKGLNEDEQTGINIIIKALESPIRQIVLNAGGRPDVVIDKVLKTGKGFNVATNKYEDFLLNGIIDPVMVTKRVLSEAATQIGLLLTIEAVISETKDKD